MYDVAIIGGGPAGMTAMIYAARAGLRTVLLEKGFAGGQMATTPDVENYPGFEKIEGLALAMQMERQAKALGGEWISEEVTALLPGERAHTVVSRAARYEARTVILALGAKRRKLEIEGEERLSGRGVSYCATCDGGFFRKKPVCVIGGGNTALEDALYLAGICERVFLIHRRDAFRADQSLVGAARRCENIEFVTPAVPVSIQGEQAVELLLVRDVNTGRMRELRTAGVFVAVGTVPDTALCEGKLQLTQDGYIAAGEDTHTSVPGIFAAGDVRKRQIYQIINACADGAFEAQQAGLFVRERKENA